MKTKDGLIIAVCQECGDHILVSEIKPLPESGVLKNFHTSEKGGLSHIADFISLEDFLMEGRRLLEKE